MMGLLHFQEIDWKADDLKKNVSASSQRCLEKKRSEITHVGLDLSIGYGLFTSAVSWIIAIVWTMHHSGEWQTITIV